MGKRPHFDKMITLYGRKPVQEALENPATDIFRLHLALSNRDKGDIEHIKALAEAREVEIVLHERMALSRISKNRRQDQGVAIDLVNPGYTALKDASDSQLANAELIAIDTVTNPQNLGLIIRSVAAAPNHALILPRKGCAKLGPLVHKASAGYLLRADIYHCDTLDEAITHLKQLGFEIVGLSNHGEDLLTSVPNDGAPRCFVLGNESQGLSANIAESCDRLVRIPMREGIESLNVAATATLVAFRGIYTLI